MARTTKSRPSLDSKAMNLLLTIAAIAVRTSIGDYEVTIQIGLILLSITISLALMLKAFGERVLWR